MNDKKTIEKIASEARTKLEKIYQYIFNSKLPMSVEQEDSTETILMPDREPITLLIFLDNEKITYYPQKVIHHSGVRYYPDGSGEPPSDDFIDLKPEGTESLDEAVKILMQFLSELKISESFEAEIMESIFKDMERAMDDIDD